MDDPNVGIRLRPGARIRYTTVEFSAEVGINAQGVRDEEPIGPKPRGEKRIVVLGDSLVFSVQVDAAVTFCEQLERQLNAAGGPDHWRVINAGVQGYGPVDDWFLFDRVAAAFEPDIVLIAAFVGNDAIEAADGGPSIDAGRPLATAQPAARQIRRLVRSSVVLQLVRVRYDQLRARFVTGTPERPLASYLADPPPIVQRGLDVTRQAFGKIADRARAIGARTAVVLVPARFQTDDTDYGHLKAAVEQAGGVLDRQSASRRFNEALQPLGVPILDLQPILFAQPNRQGLFFQRTVHLTPRGHDVVSAALFDFLRTSGLVTTQAGR
ncbi:MAG TPA: SGNH/GDSL hydrolase family protein [Vicinamibacterales bacterium]|nr:SGNH/GDSL hydrolase family protein [Vicinamibacterales bacterium]